jgi:hypothetical protein
MKNIIRENSVDPVSLQDITPDYLIDVEVKRDNVRLGELTRNSLLEISQERREIIQLLGAIDLECQARALRASSLGFSKVELAEALDVEVRQITKWIGSS